MKGSVYSRLSIMMVLQYAVWGLWLPLLGRYLQAPIEEGGLAFTLTQVTWIIGLAGSIGAITAPFIAGQVADRYFSAERCLAVLILVGGVIKYITAYQDSFAMWLILSILFSVAYMPTLGLTNSLTFSHLSDPDKQFPYVRVWGTIGWILAGWVFPMVWLQTGLSLQAMPPFFVGQEVPDVTSRLVDSMKWAGGVSVVYAIFCLFLPHTPPKRDAVEKLAFAKAASLLRRRSVLVLVLASLPIAVIHQVYFIETGNFLVARGLQESYIGPAMTIGQFAEIIILAGLGFMLKGIGFRAVVTLGAAAYFLRYAVFGSVDLPLELVVASQALHGFCYSFFFAAAFIYIDRIADDDVKHSAQTAFGIIILGLGPVLSVPVLALLQRLYHPEGQDMDYQSFWYTLAVIGLITAVGFFAFFRDETKGDGIELTKGEAPAREGGE